MARRVTILSIGTHGDLFPSLALAQGLQSSGVDVVFATHDRYEDRVRARGLEFVAMCGDPQEIMRRGSSQEWGDWDPDRLEGPLEEFIEAAWEACRGADCVLLSPMALAGIHIAEALGIPCLMLKVQPTTARVIRLHQRVRKPFNIWLSRRTGRMLPDVDLIELAAAGRPVFLYAYSPTVLPEPPECFWWPGRAVITGYWFGDSEPGEDLPPDLSVFLDAGPKPVLVTFGSTIDPRPDELWRVVLDGLRESGQRAVIVSSWTGRDGLEPSDDVFVVDHVSYALLLPKIELAVHHAGAGTAASMLRAGVPSVPVPVLFDQFLWADAIANLGAAVSPIHRNYLTSSRLAASIEAVLSNPRFSARSRDVAMLIGEEQGVATAVQCILETMRTA